VLRTLGGLAVLGVLAWRVGTEPFVAGLRAVDVSSVAAALLLVGGATVCTAQRWRVVARCAGVSLGLGEAVAAYYRSQFINSVLPGGMLGDLHRGLAHRTLRTVVWERVLGQSVQVAASLLVALVVWPADSRPSTGLLSGVAAAALVLTASLVGLLLARGVLDADALPTVLLTSVVAPACHAAVFVIAARAAGVTAGAATLVPIVLAVLVVAAVPLNVAGWGPREGAAAWAFAAVGLGAATGATVATTYGVLALVATLPGAALLVVPLRRSPAESPHREREPVAAHG
jgi:hypothetical protein